jgi:hypothetical protein
MTVADLLLWASAGGYAFTMLVALPIYFFTMVSR